MQVLALNKRRRENDLDLAVQNVLRSAAERCYIMTPYFVPAVWFRRAVTHASERGVDVRILTAGRSDVPLARVAGRRLYEELFRSGVRVFEMQDPVLHAKCLTVDGRYNIVGSYNVDAYGGKHNLEVGVAAVDSGLSRRLESEFQRRTADAVEIELSEWVHRPFRSRMAEALLYRLFRV